MKQFLVLCFIIFAVCPHTDGQEVEALALASEEVSTTGQELKEETLLVDLVAHEAQSTTGGSNMNDIDEEIEQQVTKLKLLSRHINVHQQPEKKLEDSGIVVLNDEGFFFVENELVHEGSLFAIFPQPGGTEPNGTAYVKEVEYGKGFTIACHGYSSSNIQFPDNLCAGLRVYYVVFNTARNHVSMLPL
jgi:hypothetical protein